MSSTLSSGRSTTTTGSRSQPGSASTGVRLAVASIAALAGVATMANPTGARALDLVWCAVIAAFGALAGSAAPRGALLLSTAGATLLAPDRASMLTAIAGLAFAVSSTVDVRRTSPLLGGLAGAAAACAMLLGSRVERPAATAAASWALVAAPLIVAVVARASPRSRRRLLSGMVIAVGSAIVCGGLAAIGAVSAARKIDDASAALDRGLAAARDGDVATAQRELQTAATLFDDADGTLGTWGLGARLVPGLAQHIDAATTLLGAGASAAAAAGDAAGAIDEDALSLDGGRVDLPAIARLSDPLSTLNTSLRTAAQRIDDLDDVPLLPIVQHRIDAIGPDIDRALHDARVAAEAVRVVPAMLGADTPKRYLVLLTSPTEARGRFGLPAAYAIVSVDHGTVRLEVAESINRLQGNVSADQTLMPVDDPFVAAYVDYGATRNWRSVTVPPDFPTVATLAHELWRQTGTGEIDGVLRLDTTSLGALVGFTGPVPIAGRDEPLAEADVVPYLDFEQYVQYGDALTAPRQEALEGFAAAVFDRLLTADLPGPHGLVDVFGPLMRQGHLQLASFNPDAMAFLDDIKVTGRFGAPTTPDALAVASINIGGNKIDAFLRRSIAYQATVADDGTIHATATVTLTNNAPPSGLPDYVIGSVRSDPPPKGTNQTVVLLWSALPATAVIVDGTTTPASSSQTGGWWLHGVGVSISPGASVTVRFELAGPPAASGPYVLKVVPGLPVVPDDFTAAVTGPGGVMLVDVAGPLTTELSAPPI